MSTTTNVYGFIKPDVGSDDDLWGSMLNANLDSIDSILYGKVDKSGDTVTGPITTSDRPSITDNTNTLVNTKFVQDNASTKLPVTGGTVGALTVSSYINVPNKNVGDNSNSAANSKYMTDSISALGDSLTQFSENEYHNYYSNLVINTNSSTSTGSFDELSVTDGSVIKILKNKTFSVNINSVGVNGRDTSGSISGDTWYSLWVIHNPNTNTTSGIFAKVASATGNAISTHRCRLDNVDLSLVDEDMPVSSKNFYIGTRTKDSIAPNTMVINKITASDNIDTPVPAGTAISFKILKKPVMPSGYTYYRHVGYVYVNSGGTLKQQIQQDKKVFYRESDRVSLFNVQDVSANFSQVTDADLSNILPPTARSVNITLNVGVSPYAPDSNRNIIMGILDHGSSSYTSSTHNMLLSVSVSSSTYGGRGQLISGEIDLVRHSLRYYIAINNSGTIRNASVIVYGYTLL